MVASGTEAWQSVLGGVPVRLWPGCGARRPLPLLLLLKSALHVASEREIWNSRDECPKTVVAMTRMRDRNSGRAECAEFLVSVSLPPLLVPRVAVKWA
jgi:hypothetical protein